MWASYLDKMSRNDGRPLVLILGKIDTSGFVNQRNFGSEIFKTSMLSLIAILKFMMRFKMVCQEHTRSPLTLMMK